MSTRSQEGEMQSEREEKPTGANNIIGKIILRNINLVTIFPYRDQRKDYLENCPGLENVGLGMNLY
jgi:hypothetical protein